MDQAEANRCDEPGRARQIAALVAVSERPSRGSGIDDEANGEKECAQLGKPWRGSLSIPKSLGCLGSVNKVIYDEGFKKLDAILRAVLFEGSDEVSTIELRC